jgi:hypothetical protein
MWRITPKNQTKIHDRMKVRITYNSQSRLYTIYTHAHVGMLVVALSENKSLLRHLVSFYVCDTCKVSERLNGGGGLRLDRSGSG